MAELETVRSVVKGVGGYLPERVVTNADLTQIVDTSDEWIAARTGIRERHIVADGELTSTMGTAAAKAALADAGLEPDDIDLIVLATGWKLTGARSATPTVGRQFRRFASQQARVDNVAGRAGSVAHGRAAAD